VGKPDSIIGTDAKMRGDFYMPGRYPNNGGIKSSESALSPAGGFVQGYDPGFNLADYNNEFDNPALDMEINKLLNEKV